MMFYGHSVDNTRAMFFDTWRKYQLNTPLTPLEQQVLDVIIDHPEYHLIVSNPEQYQHQQWLPEMGESNPFLHMGLHIAIREQISTNRPVGINDLFHKIRQKTGSKLEAEHLMIDKLAEMLWESQQNNQMPDEQLYLMRLKSLI